MVGTRILKGLMRHLVQSWAGRGAGGVGLQQQPSVAHWSQHASATPTERSRNEVIIELDTAYAGTQNRQKKKNRLSISSFSEKEQKLTVTVIARGTR